MLPVAVAWSSSEGSAICYVLPVLWTTACFCIMQGIRQNQRRQRRFCPVRQVAAPGAKFAVFDCIYLLDFKPGVKERWSYG